MWSNSSIHPTETTYTETRSRLSDRYHRILVIAGIVVLVVVVLVLVVL